MNALELTGRTRTHVRTLAEPPCDLHPHAVTAFLGLRRAARSAGIDLTPVSGFRDFERQLAIWNGKFQGNRPLNDAHGHPLDAAALTPAERIDAILLWSALPGASRHHWGTDLDVIDAGAVPAGYRAQLNHAEFEAGGPFERLHEWLESHAARFGFFRPFRGVLSGVRAEPWHLSFAPVADGARRALSVDVLQSALAASPLEGKAHVLGRLPELHARYVASIDWP